MSQTPLLAEVRGDAVRDEGD